MASLTYNLKKYLKFNTRKPILQAEVIATIKGKVKSNLKSTFYRVLSDKLCKLKNNGVLKPHYFFV